MTDALSDLLRRFRYTHDARDRWTIMDNPTGPLRGDCEDFALTALWLLCGKSRARMHWWVLTGKAAIWHVRSGNDPHAALWVRGRGWIDNQFQHFGPRRFPKVFPYLWPMFAAAMVFKG